MFALMFREQSRQSWKCEARTEALLQHVVDREVDYNGALEAICSRQSNLEVFGIARFIQRGLIVQENIQKRTMHL